MIAIEHVHSSALKLSLLVQFPQKHDNTCMHFTVITAERLPCIQSVLHQAKARRGSTASMGSQYI